MTDSSSGLRMPQMGKAHFLRLLAACLVVLTLAPVAAEASPNLVTCADRDADGQERVEACSKLIASAPDTPTMFRAYVNRGLAYHSVARGDLALKDFSQAIVVDPENPVGYYRPGIVRSEYGLYTEAVADLDVAIAKDPTNVHALRQRSYAHYRLDRDDLAIRDLNLIIAMQPKDAEAYYSRGTTYVRMREWDRARESFNKAIELEPSQANSFPLACFTSNRIFSALDPKFRRGALINWPKCDE